MGCINMERNNTLVLGGFLSQMAPGCENVGVGPPLFLLLQIENSIRNL